MAQVEIIKPNLITEEINTENNSKKRVIIHKLSFILTKSSLILIGNL